MAMTSAMTSAPPPSSWPTMMMMSGSAGMTVREDY